MAFRHNEVLEASVQLANACRIAIRNGVPLRGEVERSVRKLARTMRNHGALPEKMVIAVKESLYLGGAGPAQTSRFDGHPIKSAAFANLVTLAIEEYYAPRATWPPELSREKPQSNRLQMALCPLAMVAAALLIGASGAMAQRDHHAEVSVKDSAIQVPASIREEHEKIHNALTSATKLSGPVGDAARELAAVLHPHFVREEQIGLPPLGLLAALARGEHDPAMERVLPMTDSLRAELPRMLQEHKVIRAATIRLGEAARAANNESVMRLVEDLKLHAQSEEEVMYPAAILAGDLVRMHQMHGDRH